MINTRDPDFTDTPVSTKRPDFGYQTQGTPFQPYATIITPFYNEGPTFHETACSVTKQSFQQWEWLIINDGSENPEALSILDEYRKRDRRIRVIDHERNKGLSAARNTGFKEARSEFVIQIDADDLIEPTAIEKWLWFLDSYPEFSFCKGYSVGFGAYEYLWNKGFHSGREFLTTNLVNPTVAIRKSTHKRVGGYDESDFSGLMDWDFWLRCARCGYWGGTVPEYLDWYRRRETHTDRWPDFDGGKRQRAYGKKLRNKYETLWNGGFPQITPKFTASSESIVYEAPFLNPLKKEKPRLLMILPWLTMGGADRFNLDLIEQLKQRGWEVSIVATSFAENPWYHYFANFTPDIFILPNFIRIEDYPRFLRYLIHSRQIDTVMVSHSEIGYRLLTFLRSHFPDVTFVDFCHLVLDFWNDGGFPRMALEAQEILDLNIVSSEELRKWVIQRGGDPDRTVTCYTNIDTYRWCPDRETRERVRRDMRIGEDTAAILYGGRICEQKQPAVFARTMLLLKERGLPFFAIIAGDGPDHKWLVEFLKKNKLLDKTRILGEVSIQRMKELMEAADILFLPSKWEGISLMIYEAMACGLPIVSADVGGQRELVTSDCGFLISPSNQETDSKRYAEKLALLAKNARLRVRMGISSRDRVSTHFGLARMGENMIKILARAKNLHDRVPRPVKSHALGRESAALALKYFRSFNIPDEVFDKYNSTNWRLKTYFKVKFLFEPLYQWGLKRGWTWLFPIGEKIKKFLTGSA